MKLVVLLLTAIASLNTNAQSQSQSLAVAAPGAQVVTAVPPVTGKVTRPDRQPLEGVTVTIKGSTAATKTDEKGNFSLDAQTGQVLVFSFVGYETREVTVGDISAALTIEMVAKEAVLDEVIVSYGTQKRKEITGAIADIDANKLKDQPVGHILNKLQGRLAGVQINQTTGTPGQGMAIKIRGAASLSAGNNPLYVVDGIPLVGGSFGIGNMNPNEIENISVLKDASAAALYGSRAASGVVLITTKKAKAGQTNVDLNVIYGITQVPQKGRPELMNAEEWVQFQKEIYEDKAKYEGYTGGVPAMYQDPSAYRNKSTDWYDALLRSGKSSDYSLTVMSNKDKFSSTLVAGYFKQEGVVINTDYSRFSLRSNNEYRVNDYIKIGTNISGTRQSFQSFNTDGGYQILYSAFVTPPIFSPFDKDANGEIKKSFAAPGILTQPNWYRTLTERIERTYVNGLITNSYLQVNFLKHFSFKTSFGVELEDWRNRSWRPSSASGDVFAPPPIPGAAGYNTTADLSWVSENNLTFTKSFGDHNIEALAGYSAQKFRREYNVAGGTNFEDDLVPWISGGPAAFRYANSGATHWSLLGMYGRLNYNYKGKYLLNAAFRRDASSRFGTDTRWGTFPSISLGWIVSDEAFASNLGAISYLKLRAGYGETGNFNIGDFTQYPNIGTTSYPLNQNMVIGRPIVTLGNSLLTWETTKGINIGADFGILKDRILLSFDYYNKTTEGLLYNLEVPLSSGFGSVMSNVGEFRMWGYELALSSKNFVRRDFTWTTDINVSINRNKAIRLGANNTPIGGIYEYGDSWRTEVGQPIGQFWGYVYDGIYMTEEEFQSQPKGITSMVGTVRFKDLNKDGKIDAEDRTFIGNPNPDFIFGINNSLTYKNVDLNVVTTGAVGGDIFDAKNEWLELIDGLFNTYSYVKDRWRSLDDPGAGIIGRTSPGTTTAEHRKDNSRYVHDGTFLTIKNITLGYTYERPLSFLRSIRAFVSIQQALVFSKYPNPEVSANGLNALSEGKDAAAYPIPRIFSLGLNVNF